MKLKKRLIFAILAGTSTSAFTATISVNFTEEGAPANQQLAPATAAGIGGLTNWNNTAGASGNLGNLIDDSGAITTAEVTWASKNTWGDATAQADATAGVGNAQMRCGYLDDGDSGANWTMSGIPYLTYSTTVYYSGDADGNTFRPATVNGKVYAPVGSKTVYGTNPGFDASNTIVSDNLVGSLSVNIAPGASGSRGSVGGFQITDTYTGTFSYWDTNDATPGSGDTGGTWGTDNFWSNSADGTAATTAWADGNAAVFSAGTDGTGSHTITIAGTVSPDAVWVQNGDVTLSGGMLDLTAGSGILRGDGGGLVVNSDISAANLVTSGQVTLNGTNSISDLVTIGGTTTLGADNTFPVLDGSGALNIGNHALTVGSADNSAFAGSLSGTGSFNKVGAGTFTLNNGNPSFTGLATVTEGTLGLAGAGDFNWNVDGAGNIAKFGANETRIMGDITTTGAITINSGILQVGNVNDEGSIPTTAPLVINTGVLRYRHNTLNNLIAGSVSLGPNAQIQQYAGTSGNLTITGNISSQSTDANGNAVDGMINATKGSVIFSGTTASVRTLQLNGGQAVIEDGSDLTFRYLNIGTPGNAAGVITQTGGNVTMEVGDYGIRVGHWSGAGRAYNISGGTLDASNLAANAGEARYLAVGWDGEGDMAIGGGAAPATVKVVGMLFDRNRADVGGSSATTTLLPNGVLEVGALGLRGQGTNDGIILSGGLLRATATGPWDTPFSATTATTSTLEVVSGTSVNQSRPLSGEGNLIKTGTGTLALSGAASTFTGSITANAGTLKISGDPIPTAASVTVASGGKIGAGTATVAGTGNVPNLTLTAGSSSNFRIGANSDRLNVTAPNGLTIGANHTISVTPVGDSLFGINFPLFSYDGTMQGAGFSGLVLAATNPHYTLSLTDNTANSTVDVSVLDVSPITWAGPGEWNLTDTNWDDDNGASKFYTGDIAIFGDLGAEETVVINTNGGADPVEPADLFFDNTSATTYIISGDPISGGTGLTKTDDGTVILTNNNTFTGAIDVQSGKLQIGNGGTTGSLAAGAPTTVEVGATLAFNRSDASTLPRATTGTGELVLESGDLTISAGNNAINMIVDSGTLFARGGGWGTSFNANRSITVNAGGTLDTNTHGLGGLGGGMLPSLVDLNGGTWRLNGEQYVNNFTMTGGTANGNGELRTGGGGVFTINASPDSSVIAARLAMFNNKTIQVADGAAEVDLLISGPINNNRDLTKTGPGTMVSSGENTSSGAILVNEGTFVFTGDNSARTGGLAMNGTTFETSSLSNAAIGTGYFELRGGTLIYTGTGAETVSRFIWIDQGSGDIDITEASATLTLDPTGGLVAQAITKNGPGSLVMEGPIEDTGSVTVNSGSLQLNGANTYTGETTINDGATLAMTTATLDDASTVNINGTGQLNLAHGTTDLIGALVLDGTPATAPGTYGSPSSTADFKSTHFAGTGMVEISATGGDPYAEWETTNGIAGVGANVDSDTSPDGVTNGIEFVIGGDPINADSSALLPTSTVDDTNLIFVFRRTDASVSYDPHVKYGSDLVGWVKAENGIDGVTIVEEGDGFEAGVDRVTVSIPRTLAVGEKMFARLEVEIP